MDQLARTGRLKRWVNRRSISITLGILLLAWLGSGILRSAPPSGSADPAAVYGLWLIVILGIVALVVLLLRFIVPPRPDGKDDGHG